MDLEKFSEMLKKTDKYTMLQARKESEAKAEKFEALWKKNKYAQTVYSQLLRKAMSWERYILPRLKIMAENYWGDNSRYGYTRLDKEELKIEVYRVVTSSCQNPISLLWEVTGQSVDFGIHRKWPLFIVAAYAQIATEPRQKLRFDYFFETVDSYGTVGAFTRLTHLEKALIKVFNEGPFYAHPNFDF